MKRFTICSAWLFAAMASLVISYRFLHYKRQQTGVQQRAVSLYRQRPLVFEPNEGQANPDVRFLSRGDDFTLLLTGSELRISLREPGASGTRAAVTLKLPGGDPDASIAGLEPLPGRSHYLIGNREGEWKRNIPQFGRVRVKDVYPGIHLDVYGNQRRLEYDFVVAPGGDPEKIRLAFEGVEALRLDSGGDLVLDVAGSEVRQHKPVIFQEAGGRRKPVEGRYRLEGRREAGFELGQWDRSRPLRIDPVLSYSTYLGGDAAVTGANDTARGIGVDASGNVYVAGQTESTRFPATQGALQATAGGGGSDAFVAKLSPDLRTLIYATYLGGDRPDSADALAVDPSGEVYVTGYTDSAKFPTTSGALQTTSAGSRDVFVAKLSVSGGLIYSTYLGGSDTDSASAIAANWSGEATVTGTTFSANFRTTPGALQASFKGGTDAFVAKLNPQGAGLVFSTYLGGSGFDAGNAVVIDPIGNAYVGGSTMSSDFPLSSDAARRTLRNQDGFVTKLGPVGDLVFSTLVGGNGSDLVYGLAADSSENVYVTGSTGSTDLPVTVSAQPGYTGGPLDGFRLLLDVLRGLWSWRLAGGTDAFFVKLSDRATNVLYSMYLGGKGNDVGRKILLDPAGDILIVGETESSNFPTTASAMQPAFGGGPADAFLVKLSGRDFGRQFATFLGGDGEDRALALALDAGGNIYLAGSAGSNNLPNTAGAYQAVRAGGADAFVARLDSSGATLTSETYLGGGGGSLSEEALGVAVDGQGNAYITGRTVSSNFPVTDGALQTAHGGGTTSDAFITKVDAAGKTLLYSTYLGGNGEDIGYAISVDPAGSAYVTGITFSRNFPVSADAAQKNPGGNFSAFVTKLSPDGNSLSYSTFLAGQAWTQGSGIAVDSAGNAHVAGMTKSADLSTTAGAYQTKFGGGGWDAFVTKVNAKGTAWVYSTYLGGNQDDQAAGIVLDSAGNAYVAGWTSSRDFPITGTAQQKAYGGAPWDGFIAELDPSGSQLLYSTYLGGSQQDELHAVALDPSGNIYVAGRSNSADYPVTSSLVPGGTQGYKTIVTKLDGSGRQAYSVALSASAQLDVVNGIAVDGSGSAYVTGQTASRLLPSTDDAPQVALSGTSDGFLVKLDPAGKSVQYATYLGGSGDDRGTAIQLDSRGNAYVVGQAGSGDFAVTQDAAQRVMTGPRTGFDVKFDFSQSATISRPLISKVVNHASGQGSVAPGCIITITGEKLASQTMEAGKPLESRSTRLPVQLGGTRVLSGGSALPLFSVSPEKIVAQLNYGAVPGSGDLTVSVEGVSSRAVALDVRATAVGVFGVYKTDLSPVTSTNVVRPGDTIVALVTGAGRSSPDVSSGVPVPDSPALPIREKVQAFIAQGNDGSECVVQTFTQSPGMIGVAQLKCQINPEAGKPSPEWDFFVSVSGYFSNRVRFYMVLPKS